ncbi:uncharacterized protein TRIADDRAFT_52710 [Trichoplax adhaerens]|uniref:GIY-YIG domain-containing protein n=1 Tax=Trichoplax adhaerens TaxID=10228 RepID=B3RJX3_TRIAD|nr:predicted protein [Trichoplax adhaerens]EDV29136.1 predicted protein [Trichoplax adhaerens]|eukprot:XP_002108338.1 predicted protein [Trichoplax adhaerens]
MDKQLNLRCKFFFPLVASNLETIVDFVARILSIQFVVCTQQQINLVRGRLLERMLFVEDFEKNNYSGSNPPPERQGVYMITDSRDEVLYVGETENLARREREHKNFDMFKKTEYFLWHELPKNTSDKRRREIETN